MYRMISFYLLFSCSAAFAQTTIVRYPGPEEQIDPRKPYFVDLLTLALEQTRTSHGDYELQQISAPMYQARQLKTLERGLIDIMWTMTSAEREKQARAIYIPLMKGLLGYRVLLIHRKDQTVFANIHETAYLKTRVAYQGHDWPDTEILRSNGFIVETSVWYKALFKMLDEGRFDYFPRGILEAWAEVEQMGFANIMVEPHHLLVYPTAIYFFVHPENKELAERIQLGLERAQADGSFDELLFNHPLHVEAFRKAALASRRVHKLDNPLLSDKTPLQNRALWYSLPGQ